MAGPRVRRKLGRGFTQRGSVEVSRHCSRITSPSTSSTPPVLLDLARGLSASQLQSQSNPPGPASSPVWRLALKTALGQTDQGLMDRGRPMAAPGEPCTGLRVSPICLTLFPGARRTQLLGKAPNSCPREAIGTLSCAATNPDPFTKARGPEEPSRV